MRSSLDAIMKVACDTRLDGYPWAALLPSMMATVCGVLSVQMSAERAPGTGNAFERRCATCAVWCFTATNCALL